MINKSKLLKRLIIAILLLACVATFVAHKFVQSYGFDGLGDFITVYRHNKNLASKVEPVEMKILLSDDDYDFLKKRRDKAIERGIQINDGEDNYVPCKIIQNGDTVKAELRLKGHMTDHLEGDKWSFRVKTDKKPVLGMRRFSLQEPGTRNYAYEWVYHQLLKQEEIIHLNYDFIHLQLNDKDLGIYAIEEHFGQHVLDHNDRPWGAILRWNPNLYWEWRIDELQGTYLNEQYSNYSSSFVEPYEKGTVEDDSVLLNTYMRGAALLEAFRRGEKKTSDVFDITLMARFHAIIDLVGGHHSLDWSDVKFFYNSKTDKIEPVGYESFSVRKTESVCGQRIPDVYDAPGFNYHDQLFADPLFFEAYIKELERIADEKYFNNFIVSIQAELDQKNGIIAKEYPYKKFSFVPYFENIDLIRQNLQLPKPFHAFIETKTDSAIAIQLSPVSDFPIEILSLVVNGKHEIQIAQPFILPAKARNTYAHYFYISFNHPDLKLKNLVLKARIPGSSWIFETEVSDLPASKKFDEEVNNHTESNLDQTSMIQHPELINFHDSIWFFNTEEISIDQTLVFADSQDVLVFFPGQRVNFGEQGSIVSSGRIEFRGSSEEDGNIEVNASEAINPKDKNSKPKILLQDGDLICSNVSFLK
ncbi:MAG: CotH kinase family protein [Crocinitomicaceae bacterium]|nr:CotH kinase family protein [Crocinitomicaceae bacterium]